MNNRVVVRAVRTRCRVGGAGLVGLMVMCVADTTIAGAFDVYGSSYRRVDLPPVSGGSFSTAGDVLPDGRILSTTGDGVYLETGVKTGVFDLVATLDTGGFGGDPDPGFLRVSPDGARIALGGGFGKPLAVFDASALGTSGAPGVIDASSADYFNVGHFDAEWADNSSLAITAGEFGQPAHVTLLDITSDTAAPINPVIIENINGASAGIAFDAAGRLYTGNGFTNGGAGSDTGVIRVFEPSDWSITSPADFEAGGLLLGDVLSAGGLTFDNEGNLFVGGGDFVEGETGYLAVINESAIAAALSGFGPIEINDPLSLRRLDPLGTGAGFFGSNFNPLSGELYVTDGVTWWATAPSPGPVALLVIAASGAARRRRRDA